MDDKQCVKCGLIKPLSEFNKNRASKGGYRGDCKSCQQASLTITPAERWRQKVQANPDLNKEKHLLRRYGLTLTQWKEKLEKQGGLCAICKVLMVLDDCKSRLYPVVDHDHECCPGKNSCGKCVRDLICGNCNLGLGSFKDSIEVMQAAIEYRKAHQSRLNQS